MSRRTVFALASPAALVLALLAPGAVVAAPGPDPGGPPPSAGQPSTPKGDRDGDRISDDFAPKLRAANPGDKLDVIVTGVLAEPAARAVGKFRVSHRLPLITGFSATMTAAQARALARHPKVQRVSADGVMKALDDATNADYGATAARTDRPGLSGAGRGICVVDTGADPAHEQIAPRPVVFKDFIGTRTAAYDDHGHGTHVMSIAAGDGTGGSSAATFVGVAPGAALYAAKVLDGSGFGSDSQVIAGIQWCHGQAGVQVISMSLGDTIQSDGTDPVSQAVNAASAGGDVVVVAAGNSGDVPKTINSPAVATGAIAVGAASDYSAPAGTPRRDNGIWLAAFSSRGPTIDGRAKPEITAPGTTVTAARAGSTSGYATYNGTSMATPYVAGAVALALEAAPGASVAAIRNAMLSTAADRGAAGLDNEWGAGLIDVRAFVDSVAGQSPLRTTAFPTWSRHTGNVPNNGQVLVPITIGAEALGVPLAATLTVTSGQLLCDTWCQIGWTAGEWTPDLDVELLAPNGTVVANSQCALSGVSCTTGRQETIGYVPQTAGTYNLRVYAWQGGNGNGGSFAVDISRGPVTSGGGTPPPPPPANTAPVADAGPDQTVKPHRKTGEAAFTLDGTASFDPDGDDITYRWTLNGQQVGTFAQVQQTQTDPGDYVYELTVTDPDGATDSDTVTVTVGSSGKGGGGKGGGKPSGR